LMGPVGNGQKRRSHWVAAREQATSRRKGKKQAGIPQEPNGVVFQGRQKGRENSCGGNGSLCFCLKVSDAKGIPRRSSQREKHERAGGGRSLGSTKWNEDPDAPHRFLRAPRGKKNWRGQPRYPRLRRPGTTALRTKKTLVRRKASSKDHYGAFSRKRSWILGRSRRTLARNQQGKTGWGDGTRTKKKTPKPGFR